MHDWELLLADTAYASVPHCLCKKKKPRGRDLIFGELLLNRLISSDRARVEHVNAMVEVPWMIMRTSWRGSFEIMHALVVLLVHSLAYERRQAPLFRPVGPWGHDPAAFL